MLKKKGNIRFKDLVHSVICGVLVFSVAANIYFLYQNRLRNKVETVVDGDSFSLTDGRRVRLLGVDAPELPNCKGMEAKDMLSILIAGKSVRLKDRVNDSYGRILANVFSAGKLVNKEMVKSGLGQYVSGKNNYHEEMRSAADEARAAQRGIFSDLCRQVDSPEGGNCLIKGNIRHGEGERIYHLPECRNYDQVIVDTSYGDRWFCTKKEAIEAGFTIASNCQ